MSRVVPPEGGISTSNSDRQNELGFPEVLSESTTAQADVGKAARQGGAWAIIGYAFSKVCGFASSIVLARLLMPEHFGLIAMVGTVTGMVQVLGFWGIGAAVIYQREDVDEHTNTAWWLDVISGLFLFGLANAVSPLAALYYHEPRVQLIILVVACNFLLNPVSNVMEALLRRDLQFKLSTSISMIGGVVVSIFTILFAFMGAGVWSFVYPTLIGAVVVAVLRWRVCSFRPRLPVQWNQAARVFGYGKNLFGAGVFDYINQNVAHVLVGGLLGGRQLGFYLFAYNLGTWIVQNIAIVISTVLFPTVTSIRHDHERASALFLRLAQVISIVGFPLIGLQWAIAPLYLASIYGEKWLPCVTAFRLICVYGMGRAVCNPGLSLISAMGRPDINFKMSAAVCPMIVAAVYLGSRGGIDGVALATALAHGVFVWFYVIVPFRILGWDVVRFFRALAPASVSSVLAAALVGWTYATLGGPTVSLSLLGALAALYAAAYCVLMLFLFRQVATGTFDLVSRTLREVRQ